MTYVKYMTVFLLSVSVGCTALVKRQYQPIAAEKFIVSYKAVELGIVTNDPKSSPSEIFFELNNEFRKTNVVLTRRKTVGTGDNSKTAADVSVDVIVNAEPPNIAWRQLPISILTLGLYGVRKSQSINVHIKITENKNRKSTEFEYKEELITLVSTFPFMTAPRYKGNVEPISNLIKISLIKSDGINDATKN